MKMQDMPLDLRPQERLEKMGIDSLTHLDLWALIIRSGNKKNDCLTLASNVHNLVMQNKKNVTQRQLRACGLGKIKAYQIRAVIELINTLQITDSEKVAIKTASDVAQLCRSHFNQSFREEMLVLFLDSRLQVISKEVLFTGSIDQVTIHPREIFHRAIKHLAHSIILVHNHPSGDCTPSEADITATKTLISSGQILGIHLLDHIIVSPTSYWSYQHDALDA